jgi:hypothetical protein
VPSPEALGLIVIGGTRSQAPNNFDLHVSIDAVMVLSRALIGKETKEEKDISYAYSLPGQVRLGCSGLTKGAAILIEHWVFVAQLVSGYPAARYPLDNFSQAKSVISSTGAPVRRDW